jgi:hypothetical protein
MFHDVFVGNTTTLEAAQCAITQCSHDVVIESRRHNADAQALAV